MAADSAVTLKENDLIKFGGTTSEFVVERMNFTVLTDGLKRKENVDLIRILSKQFLFQTCNHEQLQQQQESSLLVVYDEPIKSFFDKSLLFGLAHDANFVTIDYFSQLTKDSNNFSVALVQPTCPAFFSANLLLPKSGRKDIFKKIFEGCGCSQVYALEEETLDILRSFLHKQNVQFSQLTMNKTATQMVDIRFCDLLVVSDASDVKSLKFIETSRVIKLKSLIEAFVRVDGRYLDIENVYANVNLPNPNPEAKIKIISDPHRDDAEFIFISLRTAANIKEPFVKEFTRELVVKERPVSASTTTISFDSAASVTPFDPSSSAYEGPSLTCVVPIPANFLRSKSAVTQTQTQSELELEERAIDSLLPSKKGFVKCHPVSYCPGSIPALIGPEQLQQVSNVVSTNPNADGKLKRRILVKDSWLAEDDQIDQVPVKLKPKSAVEAVKERKDFFNAAIPNKENSCALKSTSVFGNNASPLIDLTDTIMSNTNINTTSIPVTLSTNGYSNTTNNTSTSTTAATIKPTATEAPTPATATSKFQSSFFKSLAKK